jgi:hypothetical protein
VVVVLLVVAVIVTVLFCRRRTENGDPYWIETKYLSNCFQGQK